MISSRVRGSNSDCTNISAQIRKLDERRRASLIGHVSDILAIVDPVGSLQFINPAMTTLLGHRGEDILGKPFSDLIYEEDRDVAQFMIEHARSSVWNVSQKWRLI